MPEPTSAPARLRSLLDSPGLIRALCPYDAFSALVMERAGVELLFLGGFGIAASRLGLPDLGFLDHSEMAEEVQRITDRVSVPVIVDGDTGGADAPHVWRNVRRFEEAGAAGVLIEDQADPKRCGHFAGKRVVSRAEMTEKILAALEARQNPEFVIGARTDARETLGLSEAIERANLYADTGADLLFVEAPSSRAELSAIPQAVPHPLLANMLTGGLTPILGPDELEESGYKIAVAPVASLLVTARALQDLCRVWLSEGRVDALPEDRTATLSEVKDILGVDYWLDIGDRIGSHPG